MFRQTGRLLRWGLLRNPLRTLFLLLTIVGSMSAFSTTEATLRDLANQASDVYRRVPYDLEITRGNVFDWEQKVAGLAGVSMTERILRCNISVNAMSDIASVQLGKGQLWPIKYTKGRAPEGPHEIAITQGMATLGNVEPGDTVEVAWLASGDEIAQGAVIEGMVESFLVSGITDMEFSSPPCVLTEAGLQRIHSSPGLTAMLLVKTDGTSRLGEIVTKIRELSSRMWVTVIDESDAILGVATMLTQTISLIMLMAGVGGFYMLLSLGQRERAYDLGILRAIGVGGLQLTMQLLLEGVLLLVFGALLGCLLIFSVISAFGLGNVNTALAQNFQAMKILFALLLAVVIYSARIVGNQPVTNMLRGER